MSSSSSKELTHIDTLSETHDYFLVVSSDHRSLQRTKLQAEVLYLEQQIKQIMQNFGVECFPHMEQSNSGLVQQAFLNAQRGIEEYRTKIEEKNREINELNQQIENVGR